jgi:hypothetical protein
VLVEADNVAVVVLHLVGPVTERLAHQIHNHVSVAVAFARRPE